MPTAPKMSDAQTGHRTKEEQAARQDAEDQTIPQREQLSLVPPALMRSDGKAKKYWEQTLKRMEGVQILDDLDSDILGVYCVMLSRYDRTLAEIRSARSALTKATKAAKVEEVEDALATISTMEKQLQKLESTILQYAEKLGLTPSGRVRLAQKRAEAAAQAEPDGDLFG